MPFTPKFVDMVRNLTTTTGTGAINPGSAVTGFTSLSNAVATGEQFYYCIQGVDKPAEREVGRGTMQTNGSVARDPISGNLTNFTSGTKTIALVTAAEWFAKVEQGGTGGGGATAVATLAALAALPTTNGASAILTARDREGLFVYDSGNHAALVAADARQGIYVAPASDTDGSSGAWVRKFDGPIEVNWFGTAADFVTDDLPAFDGALAVIKARIVGAGGGGALHVRAGRYFLDGTLNIHVPVHIIGDGSAQGSGGTLLRFPNNVNGVVFNYGNTHGDGAGAQGNATGSRMEGLQLWGGGVNVDGAGNVTSYAAGDSTSGHGVRIRTTFVTLRDIFAAFFGGDGFNINCSAGSGPLTAGNANDFYLEGCQSIYNRGFGYLCNGTDSNAGTINTCSAISNGGGGFIEYSFLGNSYIQCHARDNGKTDPTNSNGPVGICLYGGNAYYLVAGQDAAASTTVPGTNASVWAPYFGGGASKAWVTGLTWTNPSPYGTNPANVNGRNVFLGCYAESAQAPCQATQPSLFLGGLLDEVSVVGSATWLRGTGDGGLSVVGNFSSLGKGAGAGNSVAFGGSDGQNIFKFFDETGNIALQHRDTYSGVAKALEIQIDNSFEALNISRDSAHPYGYGAVTIARLFVAEGGVNNGARLGHIYDPAQLNGQTIARGALFWHDDAAVGEPGFYLCTTAGVAGSTAVLTPIAPVGLSEASAAEVVAGVSTSKFISPDKLFDAAAPVTLVDGATVTVDGATGINFNLTLGGNRTLANPTNMKPGQSGRIRVKQDATGGRTLTFGTNWLFAGGDPTLSSAANAIDVIAYFVNSASEIEATIVKALS